MTSREASAGSLKFAIIPPVVQAVSSFSRWSSGVFSMLSGCRTSILVEILSFFPSCAPQKCVCVCVCVKIPRLGFDLAGIEKRERA